MTTNRLMILGAVLAFSTTSVYAGPCNTASSRCRIRECPRLYRTNHWFHSN